MELSKTDTRMIQSMFKYCGGRPFKGFNTHRLGAVSYLEFHLSAALFLGRE